jgi:gamma-glutamylcyclotransferase (GGCT)/AIG2-like uncharacterized protein YtfP
MSAPGHLFVYGTLRSESSHPKARRLRAEALYLGKGSAPGLLYDLGAYPAAKFDAGERRRVMGDVFALGAGGRLLAEMDAYEGALYERIPIEVKLARRGTVEAWAYGIATQPKVGLIGSGDFVAHRNPRRSRAVRP